MSDDAALPDGLKGPFAEVYRSRKSQQWRWRLKARNGRIIATSHDAYHHQGDCLHGLDLVLRLSLETEVRCENTKPVEVEESGPMRSIRLAMEGLRKVVKRV
jgi:uncharacterized protein YegP (UPF0339 family)